MDASSPSSSGASTQYQYYLEACRQSSIPRGVGAQITSFDGSFRFAGRDMSSSPTDGYSQKDEQTVPVQNDEQVVNDEAIASAVAEDALEEPQSTDGETEEEEEESEEDNDDNDPVVCYLTEELMDKVFKKYDTSKEFKDGILEVSDPKEFQNQIDYINALVASEMNKLRTLSSAKTKLESLIKKSNQETKVGGESEKSVAGKKIFKVVVVLNGKQFVVQLRGRATFKELRERLLSLYPEVFKNHKQLKTEMIFQVPYFRSSMNELNRREMLWWGANDKVGDEQFVINVSYVNQPSQAAGASSSSTSAPKTSNTKKGKKDKKDDKSKK